MLQEALVAEQAMEQDCKSSSEVLSDKRVLRPSNPLMPTRGRSAEADVSGESSSQQPQLAGWLTTQTKDDARDKAVASHETMGLVSALLAGFELAALVEVDTCTEQSECSVAEDLFVIAASFCVGLSTIVVLETSFEYMFVMRELHHGADSAWNLIAHFRFCRRAAEAAFALEILIFLISTGLMVYVRFAKTLPVGSTVSLALLGLNMLFVFTIVWSLQTAKVAHGQGAKHKREEALIEQQRLRAQRTSCKREKLATGSLKVKRLSQMIKGSSSGLIGSDKTASDKSVADDKASSARRLCFRRAATTPMSLGSVDDDDSGACNGEGGARLSSSDAAATPTGLSAAAPSQVAVVTAQNGSAAVERHSTAEHCELTAACGTGRGAHQLERRIVPQDEERASTLEKQLNRELYNTAAVQRAQSANLLSRQMRIQGSSDGGAISVRDV